MGSIGRLAGTFVLVGIACGILGGCDGSSDPNSPAALQDLLKAKERIIADKDKRIAELAKQIEVERIEASNKLQQRAAELQNEISSISLKLGAADRERLALREAVKAGPRLEEAKRARFAMERPIYLILLLLSSVATGYYVLERKRTRDRLNLLVMKEVAELRELGGTR